MVEQGQGLFNIKLGRIWSRPERYFNERIMTKGLLNYLRILWNKGIRACGLATLAKVHVDTGMAAASMYKMAKDFKFLMAFRVKLAAKKRETRPGHTGLYGRWSSNNMASKSQTAGEILSEDFYTVSYGTVSKAVLKFKMEIKILQWWLHEGGNWSGGQHWNAMKAGKAAFEKAIHANWDAKKLKTEFKSWALKGLVIPHPEDE